MKLGQPHGFPEGMQISILLGKILIIGCSDEGNGAPGAGPCQVGPGDLVCIPVGD